MQLVPSIRTLAGTGTGGYTAPGGQAASTELNNQGDVVSDAAGNIYIGDYNNNVVRKINASGVITNVAGNNTACSSSTAACGDGSLAVNAQLSGPFAIAVDAAGNVYIADQIDNRIRKVTASTGIITTIVGTGNASPLNNNVAANAINISDPDGIAVDASGNVYISDSFHSLIYKYTISTGMVTKFIGAAGAGFSGDGGLAGSAEVNNASGLTFDKAGNLYIADQQNNRVRQVNTSGIINTLVGGGLLMGDNGAAGSATLNDPRNVAIDAAGDLLIADSNNSRVRMVTANGAPLTTNSIITTIAGNGNACSPTTAACGDGGLSTGANFSANINGVFYDAPRSSILISDSGSNRIRETYTSIVFAPTQVGGSLQQTISLVVTGASTPVSSITAVPGQNGVQEYTIGTVTGCLLSATISTAVGTVCSVPVTFDPEYPGVRNAQLKVVTGGGTQYFGMNGFGLAPEVALTPGTISIAAGTGTAGASGNNGAATNALLHSPAGVTVDSAGNLYIADTVNNQVREVLATTGVISVIAGNGTACATPTAACGDGAAATSANLSGPMRVAVDSTGDVFISDTGDNRIREVNVNTGFISTVAGTGAAGYSGDGGVASAALLKSPIGLSIDAAGDLFIADSGNNVIREFNVMTGDISTVAGNGTACPTSTAACGDGAAATAANLNAPQGVAVSPTGFVIADTGDQRLRAVNTTTGVISTVAGTGTQGYSGDGGAATSATLNSPAGLVTDSAGGIYFSGSGNNVVRTVNATSGIITTLAGSGTACAAPATACGNGAAATVGQLKSPNGVALDGAGTLYIADTGDNQIRKVAVTSPGLTFATTTVDSTSSDSPVHLDLHNIGNQPLTLEVPGTGTNPTISAGFNLASATTCPELLTSSSAATLTAGQACDYAINFAPTAVGTLSGTIGTTDNALNTASPYKTQSTALTGTATTITVTATLTTSNATPPFGNPVTFTDTLPAANGLTPTGTVTFYSGSTSLGTGTLNSAGVATLTTTALPAGTDTITAVYGGDADFATNTSNAVTETVGTSATVASTTTLTSSVNPTVYGGATTFTATVASTNSGATPTGSVTFYTPGTPTVVNMQATSASTTYSQTLSLQPGTYSVSILGNSNGGLYVGWNPAANPTTNVRWTDRYGIELCPTCAALVNDIAGDPGANTDTAALAAFQAATTFNLTTNSLVVGETVNNPYTFTLGSTTSVSFYVPDGPFANGSFSNTSSFSDDSGGLSLGVTPLTPLGTSTLNASGVGTLSVSNLPVGTDPVQAVYSGDATYVDSSSAVLNQTVQKANGADTLTTSNASPAFGASVTLTDTIPTVLGTAPTGTVTFYSGSTVLGTGTVNSSGVATLATTALPGGTDSVTAVYGGDTNYAQKTSNAVTETVTKSASADTLTTSNAAPAFGTSITLTDTIPSVAGVTPTGTVTFYNGSTSIGTGTVNSSGVATLATGSLPAGTDSVTAVYGGDTNYAQVTSNAVTETVSKVSGTDTLTTSNASPTFGTSVTLTDTIPTVAGIAPTGTVTFYNGSTAIGTGTVNSSGVATLATTTLPVGTDSVKAIYGGDGNYAQVTSNIVTETVTTASGANTLTTSNASPTFGTSVTLTDTIPTVGGTAPTGTVTFYNGSTSLGTGTVNSSGVATLVTTSLPIGTDSVKAIYGGDTNYAQVTSNIVTETVGKAAGADTLTTSNATPGYGTSVTLTDTIPTVNGTAPTGTVTFYNGSTSLGTGTVNSSGVATLATAALPIGTDSITAIYGGDSNYAQVTSNAVTETVGKANGADTLTTSNASPGYGTSVTLTDTIPTVNGTAPTGSVTFYNGSTSLGTGTVNSSGVATLATTTLPIGTDSITAIYGGDSNYAQVTSNAVTETVGKANGADTLTTSNATPGYGTSVTLTDTIPTVNGTAPTGTVTFYNGSTSLGTGTVNSSGVATLATTTLPIGTDSVTAVYGGDSNYAQVTSNAVTETVGKANGADALTTSNASPGFGSSVTLTDTIPTVNGTAPTGTVTFYNGSTSLGTGTVNSSGVATLATTALPIGTDSVTAVYGGNATYAQVTSNAVTETVTKANGADTLTTSNASPGYGSSVTFTDTIPTVGGTAPTGTVTFYSGSTSLGTGTVNSSGVATLATAALPIGTDSITAVYGGDANYAQVTSNAVSETVGKASGADTLTSSNTSPSYGTSITLTDTIPTVNGVAPTGTVTFYNGSTAIGTGTVNASGVATLATGALPVGSDSITAVYGGDANYGQVTSNAVTETVSTSAGADALTASNTSPTFGTSITLTDTIPTVGGTAPTGTVTFYNGSTAIGTGTVNSSGVATLATGSLPVGTDSITAVYGGNANYAQVTSNAVTVTVSKGAGADTLSSSNTAPNFGQSVTFTDTIPTVGGTAPTGTVTFLNGSTSIGTGTVNASGVATLTTGNLPVGTDSITAAYGGDANYASVTSNAVSETVGKGGGADTLTTSNTSPSAGTSVTLTDTIPTVGGVAPTGTVTFYNGSTSLGTGTVNASGVATLATAALPVGTDSVTAVYGGNANYGQVTSNAVTETVSKSTGADTLTSSNTSPTYGTSITLTDTIPTVNGVAPTGTVTFYNGSTAIGTGTVNASGVATLAIGSLPVGSDSITAVYGGDANYGQVTSNAVTETVSTSAGADALTASNTSPTFGTSITLTDTIPTVGGTAPTGTVTFYNGSTAIGTGTVNSSGVATLATGSLPVGTDSITAVYGGNANYAQVTSNAVTVTVSKGAGADTLSSSNTAPNFGQSVTFTDTIPTVGGTAPTGTVTFLNGSTSIGTGTVNASGVATLTTGNLPVGTDSITASYAGDANYAQVTSNAVTETVGKAAGADSITASNTSPAFGVSITLTDTIPSVGGVAPTGTVTFYNGSTVIGTGTVNASGVATLSTGSLPVGTDSITAVYGGNANYAQVTSNAVSVTVGKGTGADNLTSSNASPSFGTSVTLTDTIPTLGGTAPTGTVTFFNGSTSIGTGTVNASGVATLSTGSLPVGTDSITAVYGGDANYGQVTSNAVTETVSASAGANTLTTSNASPSFGTSITLTDTIPTVGGTAPTGTVTFYNGSTSIGTGTVNSSGVATLATGSLPVGTDSITAIYGGNTNYAQVTSNAVTVTVGKTAGADTLASSNTAPSFGQSVTFTDTIPTAGGTAPTGTVTFYSGSTSIGTGTVNASGVATLTTGSLPVGTDSVTASYSGDTNYSQVTSNAVTETVGKAAGADALTSSNASPSFGQSVTFTDTIPTVGGTAPTGTVTFYNGSTVIGTGTVNASGVATLSTGSLPPGTDSITAVYGGNASYAQVTSNAVSLTVGKAAGADALTSSNASPSFGQSVTFTDTIPTVGGTAPTGTVTFYNGSTAIGTVAVNASGVATLSTGLLPVGTDSVTAVYAGDANYSQVTSNAVGETVGKSGGADALTSSNASPSFGQSVTFTDTIPTVGSTAATGTVTFYNGSTSIGTGTVNASGVATLATGSLPVGTDSITAVYGGDANYGQVTSNAVTETVGKATAAGTLTASSTSPAFGQSIALTDTLPLVGGVAPTGTVTFYSGSTVVGTGTINASGVATLTTGTLPVGSDSITAVYAGDSNYAQNTSAAVTVTVGKAADADTLTVSNASPSFGQSVTLTDTIPAAGGVAPTGTVTFYNGSNSIGTGTVNASGVATLSTGSLPVGADSITAIYGGDASYGQVTSNAVTVNVGKTAGTDTLTSSNASPTFGQSVTFTDSIPTVGGVVPTGTVTFYNGSTAIGTGTVNASGVATLSTGSLPVGSDSITAVYAGDANYGQVTSNAVTANVAKSSGTASLTSSKANPSFGQSVTFTDTIPLVGGVAPTGAVTFYNGTTSLGTGTVNSSGVATLATGALPVGTDSVTATYAGDGNYASSSAGPVTETVGKANGADTLTSSDASPTLGEMITLTDTIPGVNGVAATGTVTFYNGSTVIGTGTVSASGVATFVATVTTANLPAGSDSITAVYSGDATYAGVTGGPIVVNVSRSTQLDSLTTSNASINLGQAVTFTLTIPVPNGSSGPTGTVTFYTGNTAIGTATPNASGVAVLTTSMLPAGSDSITGAYPGDTNYQSSNGGPLTENVAKSAAADTLTSSNNAPSVGQPVTFTDTIPAIAGIAPTGTVTFYSGTTVIGMGTVSASGVATLTTGSLPAGNESITAVYGGDSNYASVTAGPVAVTVSKAGGADTLSSSNQSPTVGQAVTFTDTIPVANGIAPTGVVTFYNGTTAIGTGTVNSSGTAILSAGSLPAGTDSITASYAGDSNYSASTAGPLTETVSKASGSDALSSTNQSPPVGQSVTFTDTLTVVNGIMPTGTVTFYNGANAIGTGTVSSSGVATLTTGSLPAGMNSITAVYGGDSNYNSATAGPLMENVTRSGGTAMLTSSNNNPSPGQSIILTDTLPTANGIVPTGTVTFYNGSTAIGTGTVNSAGVATLTTGSLPVGMDVLTAVYGGDSDYAGSTAGPITVTVGKATTSNTLSTSNGSIAVGQSVTFTATLTTVNGLVPTGSVTFYNGTTAIGMGTVNATGVAMLSTGTLPAGTDSITAVYSGDANFSSVTSNVVTETVTKSGSADVLTTSATAVTAGQAVTFTDTLPVVHGVTATGTVTFYNGTTVIGMGTVNASGVATITTTELPVGSDSITAVYSGDANYSTGNAGPLVETVSKAMSTSTLMTNNPAPVYGTQVTLTDQIAVVNGIIPTGTVTFYNGTTVLGTATLNASGEATLVTTELPIGMNVVTAVYSGDARYAASFSRNLVTELVAPPTNTVQTLTASSSSIIQGQSVTFTSTITVVGGTPPLGSITFYDGTTAIGTGAISATGVATLSIATLPVGTDSITAVYAGDASYTTSTAGPVVVVVSSAVPADFTIAATPADPAINPGQSTSYTVSLSGLKGPFNLPVVLSAYGLPYGATVTFTPASLVPGAGPATTQMLVQTSPTQAGLSPLGGFVANPLSKIGYALLLLPLLGVRRFRKRLRALPKAITYGLAFLTALAAFGGMTGCGGGYFGVPPHQYTITVTGTSGSLHHSTTVMLEVR